LVFNSVYNPAQLRFYASIKGKEKRKNKGKPELTQSIPSDPSKREGVKIPFTPRKPEIVNNCEATRLERRISS